MAKTKNIIEKWKIASDEVAVFFAEYYFGNDISDFYWVADDIGGVCVINDYFFDLNDMVDFLCYRYSKKKMFEYYEYRLECANSWDTGVNIRDYKKLKK